MKRVLLYCLPLFASAFLTGCGGNWLLGKWTVDRELTLSRITVSKEPSGGPGERFLSEVVTGLQKGVSRILLQQYEGVEIEFTSSDFRRIRNGVGEARRYEIIDRPDSTVAVVQYEDGEIATWSRVETGLRMRLPGEAEQWIYFRRLK